jgi:hypothetical protein
MQAAMRSAMRSRPSTSRKVKIPASEDSHPPSTGSAGKESFMADLAFLKVAFVLIRTKIIRRISYLSYTR